MLQQRRIVVAVTGGVAAFKAAYLVRRLVEHGAEVRTVMTSAATEFIGPQTLAALSGHFPVTSLFDDESVSPHTDLASWADLIVVAPATTATIARLAHGISEDPVSATVIAASCPVLVAPAMHTEMWEYPATQRNMAQLAADGVIVVGPTEGALAGGDSGPGRMIEPDEIVSAVVQVVGARDLDGVNVVVTAGGTREPIDPVRYVGNRSSGKMGNAIALEAARRGAVVTLVTTAPAPHHPNISVRPVETAQEMADTTWDAATEAGVAVFAAAVADFRPADVSEDKIRRAQGLPTVTFEPTPDVLRGVVEMSDRPFVVGFAAEVGSVDAALDKARDKGVDLLVANDVAREGSGFGTDTNEVTLVFPDRSTESWDLMTKTDVARRLWDVILGQLAEGAS
jgi:phosphopantothenoylcysteine decarboxylase / phosphopantothenate---cysteine ligase